MYKLKGHFFNRCYFLGAPVWLRSVKHPTFDFSSGRDLSAASPSKLLPSPFSIHNLWKEVTMHSPHLRSEELCSLSLRMECLHILFGILLKGKSLSSSPFIYYSIIYINMDS